MAVWLGTLPVTRWEEKLQLEVDGHGGPVIVSNERVMISGRAVRRRCRHRAVDVLTERRRS
jgi:hypothetical protein